MPLTSLLPTLGLINGSWGGAIERALGTGQYAKQAREAIDEQEAAYSAHKKVQQNMTKNKVLKSGLDNASQLV